MSNEDDDADIAEIAWDDIDADTFPYEHDPVPTFTDADWQAAEIRAAEIVGDHDSWERRCAFARMQEFVEDQMPTEHVEAIEHWQSPLTKGLNLPLGYEVADEHPDNAAALERLGSTVMPLKDTLLGVDKSVTFEMTDAELVGWYAWGQDEPATPAEAAGWLARQIVEHTRSALRGEAVAHPWPVPKYMDERTLDAEETEGFALSLEQYATIGDAHDLTHADIVALVRAIDHAHYVPLLEHELGLVAVVRFAGRYEHRFWWFLATDGDWLVVHALSVVGREDGCSVLMEADVHLVDSYQDALGRLPDAARQPILDGKCSVRLSWD